ncbi:MAG: hypothetical protein U5R31_17690 [Acidimicrobiia bacterium]|nr:hypothetical protein [Acidimicrobiia bacterium]
MRPPHDIWTRLRAESPVHHCDPPGYEPFWAITKYSDIVDISTKPDIFLNEPGINVLTQDQIEALEESAFGSMRVIIGMDPPEHRDVRKIAAPEFTPRAIRNLDHVIEQSAREIVDEMAGWRGARACLDFAVDVAAAHPLRVLSPACSASREQKTDILRITNQLFAFEDPRARPRSRGPGAGAPRAGHGGVRAVRRHHPGPS